MKSRLVSVLAVAGAMAATGLLFAGAASATNYTANCPGDSGYLQTLINGAGSGDTITIYGTCYGNYEVLGKTNLTLQGGSSGATLNGKAQDRTLNIQGSSVTVRNLTITNGNAPDGAGLIAYDSTLSMTNSTVKGNKADTGAGLNIVISTVDLTGVTVTRNKAQYQGGGIAAFESDLTVTASTVSKNEDVGSGDRVRRRGHLAPQFQRGADKHEGDGEHLGRLRRWDRQLRDMQPDPGRATVHGVDLHPGRRGRRSGKR